MKKDETMETRAASKPSVVFFHRKPRTVGNYSVEFIFEDIRRRLRDRIEAKVVVSAYYSTGFFKRLYNCIQAWAHQGQVNHITGDVNYLGIFLAKRKTIQTIHDCINLDNFTGIKYKVFRFFWLSIPEKRSVFITAVSESTKKEILKHHNCDPAKIIVIPVAISPQFSWSAKTFNKQCPVILQLGTAPNKNIPNLVLALKGLPCLLQVVGKKNEAYESMLKENGIQYTYEWGLTDEEIIERYKGADIITLVSTYEGFGMPILEAQAIGRPVITSNVFSMPEVAGDAAVIVDPADIAAIRNGFEKIIGDDVFREQLVARGLENIKRFNPDKIAGEYLKLYQRIV
jgi:glycosyltransferase involved in cell wall biosynthesis